MSEVVEGESVASLMFILQYLQTQINFETMVFKQFVWLFKILLSLLNTTHPIERILSGWVPIPLLAAMKLSSSTFQPQSKQLVLLKMSNQQIQQLLEYDAPIPGLSIFSGEEVKRDLKLILQVSTKSQLNRKAEKDGKVVFFCKKHGKECFSIRMITCSKQEIRRLVKNSDIENESSHNQSYPKTQYYKIIDEYQNLKHVNRCQYHSEEAIYFKIYCLMQLKKNVIERFIIDNQLTSKEPSEILQKLSICFNRNSSKNHHRSNQGNRYFFETFVKDHDHRKSLKKKFDNIVNIDIKPKLKKILNRQTAKRGLSKELVELQIMEKILSDKSQKKQDIYQEPEQKPKIEQGGSNENLIFPQKSQRFDKIMPHSNIFLEDQIEVKIEEDYHPNLMGSSKGDFAFNYSQIYDMKSIRFNENNSWFQEQIDQSKRPHPFKHRSSLLNQLQESHFPVSKIYIEIEAARHEPMEKENDEGVQVNVNQ